MVCIKNMNKYLVCFCQKVRNKLLHIVHTLGQYTFVQGRWLQLICMYYLLEFPLAGLPRNFKKDLARSLVSTQQIRILFISCIYFTLIIKLKRCMCMADQQSALSFVGSKVHISVPSLDSVGGVGVS